MTHTRISLLIPLALLILLLSPQPVSAATIAVGSSCSLANAITSANTDTATGGCTAGSGDDSITLSSTVTLSAALPTITTNITISGGGTIDGADTYRVLHVTDGHLTLDDITVTKGKVTGEREYGGGIYIQGDDATNKDPSLTLTGVTVSSNTSEHSTSGGGGGIGFFSSGALSISDSAFSNNSTGNSGGAIRIGGEDTAGAKTISNSVFSGNSSSGQGAAINAEDDNSTVTIERSAFHGNSSSSQFGIIAATDGIVIKNSTFYGNSSTHNSGSVIWANARDSGEEVSLLHVTIAGNTLPHGLNGTNGSGAFNVYNSIIAGGSSADCNVSGGFDAQAGNLIEDDTCSPALSGDPLLATTAAGSPPYLLPQPGSKVIDAADDSQCANAGLDQRGATRPFGGACDIGAVEFGAVVLMANITVSDTCSLANAITAANTDTATGGCPAGSGDDVIAVSSTVTLAAALPTITSNISIAGGGTIDGNDTYRVLHVTDGHFVLDNMTVTKGKTTGGADGAGILVEGVTPQGGTETQPSLTLSNSTVSDSSAEGSNAHGGGIRFNSRGNLRISDSVVSGNSAAGNGGGLITQNTHDIEGQGPVVTGSVFSGNSAAHGGAIALSNNGPMVINRSAFHGNSITGDSGIIWAHSSLDMKNSTMYGNSAANSNASAILGFSTSQFVVYSLNHVTIDNNSLGRGITNQDAVTTWNVYNSIIAGASGSDCVVAGGIDSQAGNLIEDDTCSPAVSGDPMLAATAAGNPPYLLPQTGSPALNAADDTQCANAGFDQRGGRRPHGRGCDIGAVELIPPPRAGFRFTTLGLQARFNSVRSFGDDLTYSWDFGDSSAASAEAHPTHTYAAAGSYNVTLTVTNQYGSHNVTDEIKVPRKPSAGFRYFTAGLTVSFESLSTRGSDLRYTWDFGDNSAPSHEANPIHTYAKAGDYSVTLTVSNSDGDHTTAARSFSVAAGATLTVSASCSLADAITAANSDAAAGGCPAGDGDDVIVVSGTETLGAALPEISSNITINGGGTIDGDNSFRVLQVGDGGLWLDNMTIARGRDSAAGGLSVSSSGRATVTGSVFHNNQAIALFVTGIATIKSSAFYANGVSQPGTADSHAIAGYGGLTLENSTIYGNYSKSQFSGQPAVIAIDGGTILRQVTVANNMDGGIGKDISADIHIYNSVSAGHSDPDCSGWSTQAGSLIEDGTCSPALSGDPMLASAAAGIPGYFLPQTGSQLIGAADPFHCAAAGNDQRGNARPRGGACDIGAVQAVAPSPTTFTIDASCTLANAITAANTDTATGGCPAGNGDDIIVVSGAETLSAALPEIASNITINGGGTIDGADTVRVLSITHGHVIIEDMTITQGKATGGEDGGGIQVMGVSPGEGQPDSAPSLTLINSVVSESAAEGANANGGGIYFDSAGVLRIVNSRIINNSAAGAGGGLHTESATGGAAIIGSDFSGNSAAGGGAVSLDSGAGVTPLINRSAFHGNSNTTSSGIIRANSNLDMRNSSVYGNSDSASSGAAVFASGSSGQVTLSHVTIADNTVSFGINASVDTGTFNLYNSIVAGSSSADCATNLLDAKAGNLIEDNTCNPAVMGDPMLASTATGSPPFLAPLGGGPAIDVADATHCTAAGNDQRNLARPQDAGCDIGAIERASAPTGVFTYTTNSLSVNFDSTSSLGDDLSYSWNFGDGRRSTEANPTHAYRSAGAYSVTLTVSNDRGSHTSAAQTVTVARGPTAAFTFRVNGLVATFNSSRSRGDSLSYSWNFGDGNSSTEANPTHTYATDGTYSVRLTVSNVGGSSTSAPQEVVASRPPVAAFTFTISGLEVTFDSSTSTGAGLVYSWNFGDRRRSSEANPTHTYRRSGTYSVTLTLTNVGGRDMTAAQTVTVVEPPMANFRSRRSGLQVRFYSHGSRGGSLTYAWNFGDGSSPTYANEQHPLHVYAAEGDYNVTLTLTNSEGSDMQSIMLTVAPGISDVTATPEPERQPKERVPDKPAVHHCELLNQDHADGITTWAQHGVTSGIQCQRRHPDMLYLEKAPNIEAVIAAGVIDIIDIWGYTNQEWEFCVENWRLGATGSLMFIEKLPHLGSSTVHIIPNIVKKDDYACLKQRDKAGLIVLVNNAPVPATTLPIPLGADCKVFLNDNLNFRYSPGGSILYVLPASVTLTALERFDRWIKVDFYGDQGWISAAHVTRLGNCG